VPGPPRKRVEGKTLRLKSSAIRHKGTSAELDTSANVFRSSGRHGCGDSCHANITNALRI
jgi:hypothetical protein